MHQEVPFRSPELSFFLFDISARLSLQLKISFKKDRIKEIY